MNRNSNAYTVIYAAIMVVVVAAVLAFTALGLRPAQDKNVRIEKQRQLLSSINIESTAATASELYSTYIPSSFVLDEQGNKVEGKDAFNIEVSEYYKQEPSKRLLPVFEASIDGSKKYILPMYGDGLWGPIWGYLAVDSDGNSIYGAVFAHKGETAGLGAEIAKPAFSEQYRGKTLFQNNEFTSVAVSKAGQVDKDRDNIDAISGGTITSVAVQTMMYNCVAPYAKFLESLKK